MDRDFVPLESRLESATVLKIAGNEAWKDGDADTAIEKYTAAVEALWMPTAPEDDRYDHMLRVLYANRSLVNLEKGEFQDALGDGIKAVARGKGGYIKAYARVAAASEALGLSTKLRSFLLYPTRLAAPDWRLIHLFRKTYGLLLFS